ncbi:MAG: hypothetical protein KGZ86_02695 [Candidatus Latescibacteria bacterium]|nr:hypothetical protein [Candidatus Latescibacterota bacterium]
MLDTKLYPFGENGITFTFFRDLVEKSKISDFLFNIDWTNKDIKNKLKKELVQYIFLFPSFGRGKQGRGEPDAIITTTKYNIIFEFETASIDKLIKTKSEHYTKQMKRFIVIGKDLCASNKKRLTSLGFPFSDGGKVIGTYKQRKMFKEVLGKKPYYVLITDDDAKNNHKIFSMVKNIWPAIYDYFGFMNYGRIKRMRPLSNTKTIINFNLDE